MASVTVTKEVEVDVNLDEIDTDDLLQELAERQEDSGMLNDIKLLVEAYQMGRDTESLICDMGSKHLGKVM